MKRITIIAAVITLGGIVLKGRPAVGVPSCNPRDESLTLEFPVDRTIDGQPAQYDADGRYTTDAGVAFHQATFVRLYALPLVNNPACNSPASEVSMTLIDPWTNQTRTIGLAVTP